VASFRPAGNLLAELDASPVVFMYRQAIELSLKAMVLGEGGNFLATKPDHISVSKTHSVSWLAQFVCQMVTALKWEGEFRCAGIETLADVSEDFLSLVERGINAPSFETIEALAAALETDVTALFTFPDEGSDRQRVRMVRPRKKARKAQRTR
jgi:hypothetical protein